MFVSVLVWMSISTYIHINVTNYMEGWNNNYVCVNVCSNGFDFLILLCVPIWRSLYQLNLFS